jgi:hypothetical protein
MHRLGIESVISSVHFRRCASCLATWTRYENKVSDSLSASRQSRRYQVGAKVIAPTSYADHDCKTTESCGTAVSSRVAAWDVSFHPDIELSTHVLHACRWDARTSLGISSMPVQYFPIPLPHRWPGIGFEPLALIVSARSESKTIGTTAPGEMQLCFVEAEVQHRLTKDCFSDSIAVVILSKPFPCRGYSVYTVGVALFCFSLHALVSYMCHRPMNHH